MFIKQNTRKSCIAIALLMLVGCGQKTQLHDPETAVENAILTTSEHQRVKEVKDIKPVAKAKAVWRKKPAVHAHNKPHVDIKAVEMPTVRVIVQDGGKVGDALPVSPKHDAPEATHTTHVDPVPAAPAAAAAVPVSTPAPVVTTTTPEPVATVPNTSAPVTTTVSTTDTTPAPVTTTA